MQSGIYKIINSINGKIYIGSAVKFKNRWRCHLHRLRKGSHHSRKLQNSWNKHGEDSFQFLIVEVVTDHADLVVREQHYIDTLHPFYNSRPNASSQLGVKQSPRTIKKRALASASISDETRAKMRAAKLGRSASPETRAKMSAARKGKPCHTEQSRRLLADLARGNRNCVGMRHSPEARAKMSSARKGVPWTAEQRRSLSEARNLKRAEGVCT